MGDNEVNWINIAVRTAAARLDDKEQAAAVCRYLRGEVERLEIMGAVEMPCFDIVARKMSDIAAKPYDLERAHGNADDLLCEVLEACGYGEAVEIFRNMDKWYA